MRALVVTLPFDKYEIGDVVPPGEETARVLSGALAHHVVVADHPDAPVPAADE